MSNAQEPKSRKAEKQEGVVLTESKKRGRKPKVAETLQQSTLEVSEECTEEKTSKTTEAMQSLKAKNAVSLEECPYHCFDSNNQVFLNGTWQPCPLHRNISVLGKMLDKSNDENVYNVLNIPKQYRHKSYQTGTMFFQAVQKLKYKVNTVAAFEGVLNNLASNVSTEKVSDYSYLFCVDESVDLQSFIYPYMVESYLNKKTVVPYISLNCLQTKSNKTAVEYFGHNQISDQKLKDYLNNLNVQYSEENPFNYANYLVADVVFLRLPCYLTISLVNVLQDILEERASRNLTTFVVGSLNQYFNLIYHNAAESYHLRNLTSLEFEGDKRLSRLKVVPLVIDKSKELKSNAETGDENKSLEKKTLSNEPYEQFLKVLNCPLT